MQIGKSFFFYSTRCRSTVTFNQQVERHKQIPHLKVVLFSSRSSVWLGFFLQLCCNDDGWADAMIELKASRLFVCLSLCWCCKLFIYGSLLHTTTRHDDTKKERILLMYQCRARMCVLGRALSLSHALTTTQHHRCQKRRKGLRQPFFLDQMFVVILS